jgi:uncharacterized membrane protein YedE/YeeE
MNSVLDLVSKPWPWYVGGTIIGLIVPLLLLIGNKTLGISSNLKHICAAILPAKIPFFKYDWKKESWNLFFVGGIIIGAFFANTFLHNPAQLVIDSNIKDHLTGYGITDFSHLQPKELFSFQALTTLRGFILLIVGGFLVGFGTRYANGCTSGHSIMGLSNLQLPSLIATISFMIGGFIMSNLILPLILQLK